MRSICIIIFLSTLPGLTHAQDEWIQIGSFVEWPESLKESTSPQTQSDLAFQTIAHSEVVSEYAPAPLLPAGDGNTIVRPQYRQKYSTNAWQMLPDGLLYHSYVAGEKEPRFASQWLWEKDRGRVWEANVGGRWGLVRKGGYGPDADGFQFDVEGAALVRIDPENEQDLEAVDFRAGFYGSWKQGQWRYKLGYSHISSHVGDEFLLDNMGFNRRNYVRDSFLLGVTYDVYDDLQVYGEFSGAWNANGGAEFGELQFGAQWMPVEPVFLHGAPFAAVNAHLRQEYNFGGAINTMAGWQWRSPRSHNTFRFGLMHYNGPSMQWSFTDHESLTGLGIWYDY